MHNNYDEIPNNLNILHYLYIINMIIKFYTLYLHNNNNNNNKELLHKIESYLYTLCNRKGRNLKLINTNFSTKI